jgi:hypothetical protein
MIDKKFIITIKGKEAITYNGLRHMAHEKGLKSISAQVLALPEVNNGFTTIVKASVTMKDGGIFENIGDANPKNVNKMIEVHSIRMASTRAIARCFRDALDIDLVAVEELAEEGIEFEPLEEKKNSFVKEGKEESFAQQQKVSKDTNDFFDTGTTKEKEKKDDFEDFDEDIPEDDFNNLDLGNDEL